MKVPEPYRLPEEKEHVLRKAIRLDWWTIFFLLTITIVMYAAMGQSQAMKTAWIEDILSLVPPILFLISARFRENAPTARFPYGFHRIVSIAFFGAALALLSLGLYLLIDAIIALVQTRHPTIGMVDLFGYRLWMGWLMIAALIYSAIPPIILGHLKLKPAEELHEKTLHADALMNKADWMTALAAVGGILGIGFGFWWADAVAAALISLDVLWDGAVHTKRSIADLLDQQPRTVDHEQPMKIAEEIRNRLCELDWVEDADVRIRSVGQVCAGEAFVIPRNPHDIVKKVKQATFVAENADWRIYDIIVTPVDSLDDSRPDTCSE